MTDRQTLILRQQSPHYAYISRGNSSPRHEVPWYTWGSIFNMVLHGMLPQNTMVFLLCYCIRSNNCGRGRYFYHCIFPRQALTTAVLRWHRLMCERLYWSALKGRIPFFYPATNLVASRSKACRKPAANLLKTGVFFIHSICLARARTSEHVAVRDQDFHKKKSKACHKPAWTCRKPGCKPDRKPGLQLARIMQSGR